MEEQHSRHEGTETEEPSSRALDPAITCVCGSSTVDPVMARCGHCGGLAHAACYRLLEPPELHCCLGCSRAGGGACTDPKLARMTAKKPDAMASTFLFRRLLVALVTEELHTVAAVAHRLGAEEEGLVSHLARLAGDGVVMFARDDNESLQVSGGQSLELCV